MGNSEFMLGFAACFPSGPWQVRWILSPTSVCKDHLLLALWAHYRGRLANTCEML